MSCVLSSEQSILQEEYTEHAPKSPSACTRKYGYKYNIEFVLLIPLFAKSIFFLFFIYFFFFCRLLVFYADWYIL